MYHRFREAGYSEGTSKRLMQSFYMEHAVLAEHSSWDPEQQVTTSHFKVKADTWVEDNAHLDSGRKRKKTPIGTVEMTDKVRKKVIAGLNVKPGQHCNDVRSALSGASAHTGDGTTCGGSTHNTDNTFGRVVDKKDLALKLAEAKAAEANKQKELDDERKESKRQIEALQKQLDSVMKMLAQQQGQQGSPPPDQSGSGPPTTMDTDGSCGGPQGS